MSSSPGFQDHQNGAAGAASWIKALRFEHIDSHFTSIRAAHTGTCEWLFANKVYEEWRDSSQAHVHHGFLWVKGKPGAGKSTLMKYAYLRGQKIHANDATLSHFFSARRSLLHCSAEGMYRSLLCQLLRKFPQLSFSLQSLGLGLDQDCAFWQKEHLETLLREAVLNLPSEHVTCYVDAIDECEYADAQDIVDFLQELHQAAKYSGIEFFVLVSSRHFPQLSVEGHLQITLDHIAEHEADLCLYICDKLRLGESCKANKIRDSLQQRASGIFLWVMLIIRILNEDKARGKVHLLEDHLDSLPEDLNHLFEKMLQHDAGDKSVLLLTIQWLLFADRSLRLDEFYFALVTNDLSDDIQGWDRDEVNVTDMKNFVLNTSNGLIEVTDETVPTVQLIHGTVRHYLINTWLPSQHAQPMAVSTGLCHGRLWKCCRNYILRSSPVLLPTPKHGVREEMSRCFRMAADFRSRINKSHPFLGYALHGIVLHSNASQSLGVQQQDLIRDFPLDIWVRLHNLLVINPADRISENVSIEYIFVIENALALIRLLIKQRSELMSTQRDIKGEKYQSLLGAAVANGYNDMGALLLERGADPNSLVNGNFKCLDTAVMQGNADIFHKLLAYGVAVQGSASFLQDTHLSPLHRAAESGHTEMVRALLSHPIYAAQWHPDMDHVLEAAIYRHDGGVIQLLHERMRPAKRMIIRALYAANDHHADKAGWENGMFRALHSFRMYYQARERHEPAVLDKICKAHEDRIHGSLPTSTILVDSRSKASMKVVNQVQNLLKRRLSRISAQMQLEDLPGRFHCIDITFELERNNSIYYMTRAYLAQHWPELFGSSDPNTHNDDRNPGAVWHPRESDGILRPRPRIVNAIRPHERDAVEHVDQVSAKPRREDKLQRFYGKIQHIWMLSFNNPYEILRDLSYNAAMKYSIMAQYRD
jgi:hypothetical protein